MEAITIEMPTTLAKRGAAPDELRLLATWDEYVELAEEIPYNIEFLSGEIISMSQATDLHEQLIAQLITIFNNILDDRPDYRVLGSSVKICVAEGGAEFNADLSVLRGPSQYAMLPSGKISTARIKNPEIVVEVLSKSTKAYDQSDKLNQDRLIPSLKHILFVSQDAVFARVYTRTDKPDQWIDTDYRLLTDTILVGDMELPMQKIYRKTVFSA